MFFKKKKNEHDGCWLKLYFDKNDKLFIEGGWDKNDKYTEAQFAKLIQLLLTGQANPTILECLKSMNNETVNQAVNSLHKHRFLNPLNIQ